MPVGRRREPFSDREWIFEIKWDGFRALAHIEHDECRLVSRNGNEFKSFPALNASLPAELNASSAVLDGEIVCLGRHGISQFKNLLFRRGEPRFYAFDLLWVDGEDLRHLPLVERKLRLRSVVPQAGEGLLYCDHVEDNSEAVFRLAWERDLEGIVAKQKSAAYLPHEETTWFKIRNRSYSQWIGRAQLFERERETPMPGFGRIVSERVRRQNHWRAAKPPELRACRAIFFSVRLHLVPLYC
jgi:bifunctional non-homologous end joining protein LigD